MAVRRIGSAHVGGRPAFLRGLPPQQIRYSPGGPAVSIDPNGDFEIEQMYVQYVQLQQPLARYPLLLMHGGGMSGVCYETKPDGQPGWQSFFLRAGHDVWSADAVERGRATWARSPEFFAGEPVFRSKQEAWELFRIGPPGSWRGRERQAHADTRFPLAAFDQFMKQSTPRWSSTEAATQAAYNELARLHGSQRQLLHRALHGRLRQARLLQRGVRGSGLRDLLHRKVGRILRDPRQRDLRRLRRPARRQLLPGTPDAQLRGCHLLQPRLQHRPLLLRRHLGRGVRRDRRGAVPVAARRMRRGRTQLLDPQLPAGLQRLHLLHGGLPRHRPLLLRGPLGRGLRT